MRLSREMQVAAHRLVLFALGGAAALAIWALGENWDDRAISPTLYLALFCFVTTYATVALALAGPVAVRRALVGALMLAAPITVLAIWAGQRQIVATDVLDDPVTLSVAAILTLFATPFLSVWLQDRGRWLQYEALFEAAWTMTVRYAVAWAFVAVFWLLAFLSNALLDLVDINAIDAVLRTDWARFGLSGAVLGLGLAVVYELRDTISPFLILRLLRLLVPLVLVVVGVFLLAIPFRGLTQLFGDFSAAGTLMGAAMVSITLISTALDRNDEAAVSTRGLRAATRILAVLLPLLAGLAVWAVFLRVQQYGWTPDRVLAACVALFLLTYGIGYSGVVLARTGWMARIRTLNVGMALAVIGVCVLWMTPILNAYRISAASQVMRFEQGESTLDQLAMWQMANDWGRAGRAGLERLEQMNEHPDHAELVARVDMVRALPNPFQFERAVADRVAPDRAALLAEKMEVRPRDAKLNASTFADLPAYRMEQWLEGCERQLPDGRAGCVLIRGQFTPAAHAAGQGIVLYLTEDGHARANFTMLREGAPIVVREVFDPVADTWPTLAADVVAQALDGRFDIRPSSANALHIDGLVLVPGN